MSKFPFYLSIMDPGQDTGLALLRIEEEDFTVEETATVRYDPPRHGQPSRVLAQWNRSYSDIPHVFLYENFHVRPGPVVPETTALEVIGAVEYWMYESDHRPMYARVVKKEPVQGKHQATDAKLKKLGLFFLGHEQRHVNDTMRHAVTFLTSLSYLPVCSKGFASTAGVTS